MTETVLVIPARYSSTRLPGKPLRLMAGKPMIQHVFERAQEASDVLGFKEIVIATDDERIQAVCEGFCNNDNESVCMTSVEHETGSDRLSEVVALRKWSDDTIIVNLQGDEPLTAISNLRQVAENLANTPEASIATLATTIGSEKEFNDPNVVKVVIDKAGMALYFSRAPIPYERDAGDASLAQPSLRHSPFRHIGIYSYRAEYLKSFVKMESCQIENLEKLEQLRAMWHGAKIHVAVAEEVSGHGVDTEEDLIAVEKILTGG